VISVLQFGRMEAMTRHFSPEGKITSKIVPYCDARVGLKYSGGSVALRALKRHPRRSRSIKQPSPCTATVPSGCEAITNPSTTARTVEGLSGNFPAPTKFTRTFTESSFHFEKKFNACSRDTVMFLWVARQFSFELAADLAAKFRWKLRPSLSDLRAIWNQLDERKAPSGKYAERGKEI
jgi:hypothetical protein